MLCRVSVTEGGQDFVSQISFQATSIGQLTLIQPFIAPDSRGYLLKSFEQQIFAQHEIQLNPYEELTSCSRKGVLRGLHFQRAHSQDKLVRVLHGAVYDVAVDLRAGSSTFGQWEGFYLSSENRQMLYIPKGFAHGFLSLEENTLFSYLCGDQYDPVSDGGILWNDPDIKIQWPLDQVEQVIVSEKDQALPTFAQFCRQYSALM